MSTIIRNRFTGAVLHEGSCSLQEELQKAIATGVNLRDADLSYATLRSVNLSGANLSGADLRDADLSYATLRSVNLSGANLSGADLRNTDLRDVNLRDANLSGANLSGADLRNTDLRGVNLRDAKNIIYLPVDDPRGHRPVAVWFGDHWIGYSSCRQFIISEAREHCGVGYKGERSTGDQYVAAMDWLEAQPKPENKETKHELGEHLPSGHIDPHTKM